MATFKNKVRSKTGNVCQRENLAEKMERLSKSIAELERIREKASVSVEALLEGLEKERQELYRERYEVNGR